MLTIAIPTYRNVQQLLWTLSSLGHNDFPFHVIVVNNGPEVDGDGCRFDDLIRQHVSLPSWEILQADGNWGWAKAINKAFEHAEDTEFFLMLNDDVVFLPWHRHTLGHLARLLSQPGVGAVGPASNFVMGKQNFLDPTPLVFSTSLLIGFCLMVRSQAFAEIGGLDEGLPGGDDFDLSILLRQAGYHLMVDKSIYLHHWGQQTGQRVHKNFWDTPLHQELVSNSIIRKHGFKAWYETAQSLVCSYEPFILRGEDEKEFIATLVPEGQGLDLGCGPEKTLDRAIGVDLTPAGMKGRGGVRHRDSVADIVGDVQKLASFIPPESQDYLIARHIFEHLVEPIAVLEEWAMVLKPGGRLIMALPNEEMTDTIPLDSTHKHAYTPEGMIQLLEVCGWKVEGWKKIAAGMTFVIWGVRP